MYMFVPMVHEYSYHNYEQYPTPCLLFKIQNIAGNSLSPTSNEIYLEIQGVVDGDRIHCPKCCILNKS
jgi:hypothetical protein